MGQSNYVLLNEVNAFRRCPLMEVSLYFPLLHFTMLTCVKWKVSAFSVHYFTQGEGLTGHLCHYVTQAVV